MGTEGLRKCCHCGIWFRPHRAQCLASTILFEAGMSGGQQAGEPAEVVPEEPGLFPWRSVREEGSGMAAEASGVLEGEGDGRGVRAAGCVTRSLDGARL